MNARATNAPARAPEVASAEDRTCGAASPGAPGAAGDRAGGGASPGVPGAGNRAGGGPSRTALDAEERTRYARHLALPEVGVEGQERLKAARVLLVGAGGLGSPAGLYLAAAGVGVLGLVDPDVVDLTNLQRQILHDTNALGAPKVLSGRRRLAAVNPRVRVNPHQTRLTAANAMDVFAGYDVVVDGTDNFPARYLVNDAAVLSGVPNVYGAVHRWEGQVSVFGAEGGPCYRCLFREPPPPGLVPNCAEAGVFGALPGVVGAAQALEAIKLALGVGESLAGRLHVFDGLAFRWREVEVRRNRECQLCGDSATQTGLVDYDAFCGAPGPDPRVRHLPPGELSEAMAARPAPFLLDVREPFEWEEANLAHMGAVLVPLREVPERLHEIPRGRPVVVYCRSGGRSMEAAAFLADQGYEDVINLEGGILAVAELGRLPWR